MSGPCPLFTFGGGSSRAATLRLSMNWFRLILRILQRSKAPINEVVPPGKRGDGEMPGLPWRKPTEAKEF
jgi:hypothetical protein